MSPKPMHLVGKETDKSVVVGFVLELTIFREKRREPLRSPKPAAGGWGETLLEMRRNIEGSSTNQRS